MLRFVAIFAVITAVTQAGQYVVNPGPKYPPTKGEVWPKPQHEEKGNEIYILKHNEFIAEIVDKNCAILKNAVIRYVQIIQHYHKVVRKIRKRLGNKKHRHGPRTRYFRGALQKLQVDLTKPCGDNDYPYFGMEESYSLVISTVSKLSSTSLWGILRGLETFAHLFYLSDDYTEVHINATKIIDYPRYAHRGFMLDTSRHYIEVDHILTTLDAMAMNKMNVFHWHIVDDQSFPYQSEKFPELSETGAYHSTMVYTKSNIKHIIDFARDRGIRVIPEFDVPGHTRSWGIAYSQILTECFKENKVIGLGPMDPTNKATYKLLRDLIQEVQKWFPDKYFHVGGDEVDLECWSTNPHLLDYMLKHNMSSVKEFHALFMKRVIPLLGDGTLPIVWQEVFDEQVPLSKDTLVQVWRDGWIVEMNKILSSGFKVLFSTEWYLSMLAPGGDWEKFYQQDPRLKVYNRTLVKAVVGGEACMWGEYVDDRNVISRVWPRASAIAERLWSFADIDKVNSNSSIYVVDETRHRIEEHACRMIRRGVDAEPPNGPGFCIH